MIEKRYRQYIQARFKECMEDARKIYYDTFGGDTGESNDRIAITNIAVAIFEWRVPPFYYWRQKKMMENLEEEKNAGNED